MSTVRQVFARRRLRRASRTQRRPWLNLYLSASTRRAWMLESEAPLHNVELADGACPCRAMEHAWRALGAAPRMSAGVFPHVVRPMATTEAFHVFMIVELPPQIAKAGRWQAAAAQEFCRTLGARVARLRYVRARSRDGLPSSPRLGMHNVARRGWNLKNKADEEIEK